MRLTYPQPPPEVRQLAYQALNMEMLRHPPEERPHSVMARATAFGHVPDMHNVFVVPPTAIAQRKDLGGAQHASWYDVVVLSGVSHGIEVVIGGGERKDATYVTRGSTVDHQLAVLTALTREQGDESFEVRVLRIPLLVPFSFWLKAKSNRNDRIVPVTSSVATLQPGTAYRRAEFFSAIRETAKHLVKTQLVPKDAAKQTTGLEPRGKVGAHKKGKTKRVDPGLKT